MKKRLNCFFNLLIFCLVGDFFCVFFQHSLHGTPQKPKMEDSHTDSFLYYEIWTFRGHLQMSRFKNP